MNTCWQSCLKVFGMVAEGFDTLTKINETYVDDKGRPFKDIRIKHTYILDDPFDDPSQLSELIHENSPVGLLELRLLKDGIRISTHSWPIR
ncbi:hypothetical protein GUJ93_ZPchr0001g30426 [Zizania palustris]|uniref:PPIase cyclophilin-type domain-containing protein n=1 Tax=Zizania palustris TaxID=103762 RepID=A0A8J5RU27_ZIZPA|nr:hypothetical protein GUJ93_ZPchr0001g30426 [Zizania palustris]